jgi:hypothetical protein
MSSTITITVESWSGQVRPYRGVWTRQCESCDVTFGGRTGGCRGPGNARENAGDAARKHGPFCGKCAAKAKETPCPY